MEKERKFTFCIEDMIQQNVDEKRGAIVKSLCGYLSIPDEAKAKLIEEACSTAPPNSFSDRNKKKRKRL